MKWKRRKFEVENHCLYKFEYGISFVDFVFNDFYK